MNDLRYYYLTLNIFNSKYIILGMQLSLKSKNLYSNGYNGNNKYLKEIKRKIKVIKSEQQL